MPFCIKEVILCTDRLSEGEKDLSPYNMEKVCWCRAVYYNPIAVIQLAHIKIFQFLQKDNIKKWEQLHTDTQDQVVKKKDKQLYGNQLLKSTLSTFPPTCRWTVK